MALAKVGVSVTMTCRSSEKCIRAKQKIESELRKTTTNSSQIAVVPIHTMTMDTSSLASVRNFCQEYYANHLTNKNSTSETAKIDMLFLNAGAMLLKQPTDNDNLQSKNPWCLPKTKQDDIEYMFQVNYLGHHLIVRLLEPFLSSTARIVQTSSASSFLTYSYKVATDLDTLQGCSQSKYRFRPWLWLNVQLLLSYGQSKLAQIVWCKAFTHRHPNSAIAANAFHPGTVATPLIDKALGTSTSTATAASTATTKTITSVFFGKCLHSVMQWIRSFSWQSPDGCLTGLFLASRNEIQGQYYHPQAQPVVNPLALDEQLQNDLWEFSEQLVKEFLGPIP
jgi:NAD(P)-dependent dehydrogenase (short-subunit alcohol dehydrogenase family)